MQTKRNESSIRLHWDLVQHEHITHCHSFSSHLLKFFIKTMCTYTMLSQKCVFAPQHFLIPSSWRLINSASSINEKKTIWCITRARGFTRLHENYSQVITYLLLLPWVSSCPFNVKRSSISLARPWLLACASGGINRVSTKNARQKQTTNRV